MCIYSLLQKSVRNNYRKRFILIFRVKLNQISNPKLGLSFGGTLTGRWILTNKKRNLQISFFILHNAFLC